MSGKGKDVNISPQDSLGELEDMSYEELFSPTGKPKPTRSDFVKEAMRRAKEKGRLLGTKPKFDHDEIRRLWLSGKSLSEIKEIMGCQKTTVMTAINKLKEIEDEVG